MNAVVWIALALLGGVGALVRFALDGFVQRRAVSEFPIGTLTVNGLGAFALGVLTGAGVGGHALFLAGTAVLGSFTTFSTWMLETHRLAEEGESSLALWNLTCSIAVGLAAAGAGWGIGATL